MIVAQKRYEFSLRTRDEGEALRKFAEVKRLGPHIRPPQDKHALTIGCVYFIGSDCGRIKIGWSRDPRARLAQIDQHGPRTLTLLAVAVEASKASEQIIHGAFESSRVAGKSEWYEPTDALQALIAHVEQTKALPESFYRRPRGPRRARSKFSDLRAVLLSSAPISGP